MNGEERICKLVAAKLLNPHLYLSEERSTGELEHLCRERTGVGAAFCRRADFPAQFGLMRRAAEAHLRIWNRLL